MSDPPATATVPRAAPNALQRLVQHVASWRPVAAVFRHTVHHVDRRVFRTLGGRGVTSVLGGVPEILLTTTGARTGRPRTVPPVAIDLGESTAVITTRWGSQHEPAWSHNLTADPHAEIEQRGQRIAVIARRVPRGDEYDAITTIADHVYLGFARYRRRISRRDVPIYVLQPVTPRWGDGGTT